MRKFSLRCCHWGKHCTGNIAIAVFTSRQHSENECETPLGSRQAFFRASRSTECLVGFLGREISITAYGLWQYFPLRVGDAFHCRVSQVISYKFTVLLLSVYLPLIIKGMSFGRARLCARRHAVHVLVYQKNTGRFYPLYFISMSFNL